MNKINIGIAEDNLLAIKNIVSKLAPYEDLDICITASNGEEMVRKYQETPVDIILMDIEMPLLDGIAATQKIKSAFPESRIIMLTTFDDDDKIFNAILAGAGGYLLKDESAEYIYRSIKDTMSGGAVMSPSIAFKTLQYIKNSSTEKNAAGNTLLSGRETEILTELKNGLAYKQIAGKLFISEGTVRKHIENIYKKLQVNNKMNAVSIAVQNRWIE